MGSKDVGWNSFISSATPGCRMVNPPAQPSIVNSAPTHIGPNAPAVAQGMFVNQTWQYQQVPFQPMAGGHQGQTLTPQQHQWMMAQQKAFEEQKKLYDQFMKQKQFDEQKQRLRQFGTFGVKGNVSADSMIENILGRPEGPTPSVRRDLSTNVKQPHHQPVADDLKSSFPSHPISLPTAQYHISPVPPQSIMGHTPPSASLSHPSRSDISKESASEKSLNKPAVHPQCSNPMQQQVKQLSLVLPSWLCDPTKVPRFYHSSGKLVESPDGRVDTSKAYSLLLQSSLPAHLLGVLWEMVNRTKPGCLEMNEFWCLLVLIALVQRGTAFSSPDILTDISEPIFPAINHPTLIACLQNSLSKDDKKPTHPQIFPQEISSPQDDEFDDFVSAAAPPSVFNAAISAPVINAVVPTLISAAALPPPPASTAAPSPPQPASIAAPPPTSIAAPPTASAAAPPPPPAPTAASPLPAISEHKSATHVRSTIPFTPAKSSQMKPNILPNVSINPLPILDSNKDIQLLKKMNLPSLGNSPLNSRRLAAPPEMDDFDVFQSAVAIAQPPPRASPRSSAIASHAGSSSRIEPIIDKSQSYPTFDGDPNQDKYAVLRELNTFSVEEHDKGDDSFGDFCGNFPDDEKVSVDPLPHPPNTRLGEFATENIKKEETSDGWTTDPFGEFEECAKPAPSLEFSSDSGSYVTADASADTSNDADDDFGEFVKPAMLGNIKGTSTPVTSGVNLTISEIQAETQSVASLELPGLDVTVNLSDENQTCFGDVGSTMEAPSGKVDPVGTLEQQTKLEFPTVFDQILKAQTTSNSGKALPDLSSISQSMEENRASLGMRNISSEMNSGGTKSQFHDVTRNGLAGLPPIGSFSLADKYSMIRSESARSEFEDPHSESWKKCLRGCKELLEGGLEILRGIPDNDDLFSRVLMTSQMQEYLTNLSEVWWVSKRIGVSCSKMATSSCIRDLLDENDSAWTSILKVTAGKFDKDEGIQKVKGDAKEDACSLCLTGGGASLCYAGHSYHPPCANLWLNVVDLTLPTLASTSIALL